MGVYVAPCQAYAVDNSVDLIASLLFSCCLQIQSICRLVARRSARLAASLLVAVLRLQGWMEAPRRLVVAVDGGVFLKYTNWRYFLRQYLCEAFGECTSQAGKLELFILLFWQRLLHCKSARSAAVLRHNYTCQHPCLICNMVESRSPSARPIPWHRPCLAAVLCLCRLTLQRAAAPAGVHPSGRRLKLWCGGDCGRRCPHLRCYTYSAGEGVGLGDRGWVRQGRVPRVWHRVQHMPCSHVYKQWGVTLGLER